VLSGHARKILGKDGLDRRTERTKNGQEQKHGKVSLDPTDLKKKPQNLTWNANLWEGEQRAGGHA